MIKSKKPKESKESKDPKDITMNDLIDKQLKIQKRLIVAQGTNMSDNAVNQLVNMLDQVKFQIHTLRILDQESKISDEDKDKPFNIE